MLTDLAITLALGAHACSDVTLLRAEPGMYGPVASDPTISRNLKILAADADRVLSAIAGSTREIRGYRSGRDPEVAHTARKNARPRRTQRGFGFPPLCALLDHGAGGTGEALAIMLHPGNAGSNTTWLNRLVRDLSA